MPQVFPHAFSEETQIFCEEDSVIVEDVEHAARLNCFIGSLSVSRQDRAGTSWARYVRSLPSERVPSTRHQSVANYQRRSLAWWCSGQSLPIKRGLGSSGRCFGCVAQGACRASGVVCRSGGSRVLVVTDWLRSRSCDCSPRCFPPSGQLGCDPSRSSFRQAA